MGTVRGMSGRGWLARAAGLALTLLCASALAQERIIFVNGRLLGEDAEEDDCESKYTMHEDRMCYCYGVC